MYSPPQSQPRKRVFTTPVLVGVAIIAVLAIINLVILLTKDDAKSSNGSGSSKTSTSTTSEAPPEPQNPLEAKNAGFVIELPDGWQDAIDQSTVANPEIYIIPDGGDGNININVITIPGAGKDIGELADLSREEIEKQFSTTTSDRDDTEVGGEDARSYRVDSFKDGPNELVAIQTLVKKDGTYYVITLNCWPDKEEESLQIYEEMLKTWMWK